MAPKAKTTKRASPRSSRSDSKTKPPKRSAVRGDGLVNVATGIGTKRDRRKANSYVADRMTIEECEEFWRGSDMAANVVDIPPEEMMRAGFRVCIQRMTSDAIDPSDDPSSALFSDPIASPSIGPGEIGGPAPDELAGSNAIGAPTLDAAPPVEGSGSVPGPKVPDASPLASAPDASGPGAPAPAVGSSNPIEAASEEDDTLPGEDDSQNEAKQAADDITAKLDDLGVHAAFLQALKYERAFGGGAIFIGANEGLGTNLKNPIVPENVISVDFLNVLMPQREIYPVSWYADPSKPKYGKPKLYRIVSQMPVGMEGGQVPQNIDVHESRLIIFEGIQITKRQVLENNGWGDSVYIRVKEAIENFDTGWAGAGSLLTDFAQGVYKMAGLAELVAENEDEVIEKRIEIMDLMRSTLRALLLDKDDEFTRQQTPIAGLPDMLDRFCNRLAAAFKIPVTLLMGTAPAGLNATGAADIRGFYDRIASEQTNRVKPRLEMLIRLIMCSADGPTCGIEPDAWDIEFNPLWQLTALEQATLRETQSRTDLNYTNMGAVYPEEIAVSRFGGDGYSTETVIDFELRKKVDGAKKTPTSVPTPGGAPGAPPKANAGAGVGIGGTAPGVTANPITPPGPGGGIGAPAPAIGG